MKTLSYLFALVIITSFPRQVLAETCPSDKLCPTLKNLTVSCAKWYSEKTCDSFVETYQKLAPTYDCKRAADTKPVPALWLCDVGESGTPHPTEKATNLLYKLKFKKAKEFFASPEFRATLDGESAESYLKKSEKAARAQKQNAAH